MTAQVFAFPRSKLRPTDAEVWTHVQSVVERRERLRATKWAYYAANRETILAKKRAKYAEDPEHVLQNQRERRWKRRMNMFLAREIAEGPAMLAELEGILDSLRPKLVANNPLNEESR